MDGVLGVQIRKCSLRVYHSTHASIPTRKQKMRGKCRILFVDLGVGTRDKFFQPLNLAIRFEKLFVEPFDCFAHGTPRAPELNRIMTGCADFRVAHLGRPPLA